LWDWPRERETKIRRRKHGMLKMEKTKMENLKGMGMVGGAYLPQLQGDGKAFPVPQCLILPRCSAA
jgi:hypothetical protein